MGQQAVGPADVRQAKPVLDRAHLARMTCGEPALEREVLSLFDTQAALLVARMQASEMHAVPALAHTLKGSASGIGALQVAEAAEAVERAVDAPSRVRAVVRLTAAVTAARHEIAGALRDGARRGMTL